MLSSWPCGQPCKEAWCVGTAVTKCLGCLRPPSEIAGLMKIPAEVSDGDESLVCPPPEIVEIPMRDAG